MDDLIKYRVKDFAFFYGLNSYEKRTRNCENQKKVISNLGSLALVHVLEIDLFVSGLVALAMRLSGDIWVLSCNRVKTHSF